MSRRLLKALEYPEADSVNLEGDIMVRKVIVWLETNKIRKAPPNILNELKNINSKTWDTAFDKYKDGLGCPVLGTRQEELHWLLGHAIHTETQMNKNVYLKHAVENIKTTNEPSVITENPLDKLDFRSKEFTDGIDRLAKVLHIVPHPNPLVTLRAVRKVVTNRMTPDRVEHPNNYVVTGKPFPIQESDLGFDLKDPVLNQAAKILRLLYIQDMRDLQTRANELIVAVQAITGNPKTDTKLGKVGR